MERKKLFGLQSRSWTPVENEFVATYETVEISPHFNFEQLSFMIKKIGPFRARQKIRVPLWIGIELRRAKKCRLVAPMWLATGHIEEVIGNEKANEGEFQIINYQFLEIAKILLTEAGDDFENGGEMRLLIKDLEELRKTKLNNGLKNIDPNTVSLTFPNVTSFELATVRHNVANIMDIYYRLRRCTEPMEADAEDEDGDDEYEDEFEDDEYVSQSQMSSAATGNSTALASHSSAAESSFRRSSHRQSAFHDSLHSEFDMTSSMAEFDIDSGVPGEPATKRLRRQR